MHVRLDGPVGFLISQSRPRNVGSSSRAGSGPPLMRSARLPLWRQLWVSTTPSEWAIVDDDIGARRHFHRQGRERPVVVAGRVYDRRTGRVSRGFKDLQEKQQLRLRPVCGLDRRRQEVQGEWPAVGNGDAG